MRFRLSTSVRAVAVLEAGKGVLVLLAGIGVFHMVHHDVRHFAQHLMEMLHLDISSKYTSIFIAFAAKLTDARLATLAVLAAAYTSVRFIEAFGLWHEKRWAEWFATVSGAIYIPFEIYEMVVGFQWLYLGALFVNIAVVGLMLAVLFYPRFGKSGAEA